MKQRLTFVALNVSDLDQSLRFYRDFLGLPLMEDFHDSEREDPWFGGRHAAHSWTDGAYIHFALYPASPPHRPVTTATQIGFHVSDFDAVHARVVSSGASVLHAPRHEPWGRTARYLDPDRNLISITEARP